MKNWLFYIALSISTFLLPIKGLLILVGMMVSFDTIFAIFTAWKMNETLTSTKFFNIAPKLFFYLGSIIMAFMIDTFIVPEGLFSVSNFGAKVVTFLFVCNEVKSINETYVKKNKKSLLEVVKEYLTVAKNFKKDLEEFKN